MGTESVKAFSDGVIAIIITIMVLEMKVPHGDSLSSLKPLLPVFISYVLSFINIGIYWNNHHHLMHAAHHVNGRVLWANIHLLFWLSLVPFVSGWMGENHFGKWPVAIYVMILFMAGVAYYILAKSLVILHGKNSTLATAIGNNCKEIKSITIYAMGIGVSFINPSLGFALYALVTAIWFMPDKRIEKQIMPN